MPIQVRTFTRVPSIEQAETESSGRDPLAAFKGVAWGSLLGSAFWLTLFALLMTV